MSIDNNFNPLHNSNHNRALDVASDVSAEIRIEDVDTAIFNYMENTIMPKVKERGLSVNVPIFYANAERWKSIQKNGVYLDKRGQLQIPVIAFRRNSIEKDGTMPFINRRLTYPSIRKYSNRNRYDKFSLLTATKPEYETHSVTIPDYVTLSYEVVVWTSFMEHMNMIIEQYQFAADEYWGDRNKFKFFTKVDSFSTETDMAAGQERIIKTTFNLTVNAYLLPKQFDGTSTTTKGSTVKTMIFTVNTERTTDDISNR